VDFRPETDFRAAIAAEIARHRAQIETALPDADVEHIGSTAVPGALTKGDLDLLVRVAGDRFSDAVAALGAIYAVHQGENWTTRFASFKQVPEGGVPVGVQLVVAGGTDDRLFTEWRDRLSADPALLERYNDLKSSHAGDDPDTYIEAKASFIEAVIGDGMGSEGEPADPRSA
jgi:GrpB-like predicted nucleotidyltransferase (UPF0157 family)